MQFRSIFKLKASHTSVQKIHQHSFAIDTLYSGNILKLSSTGLSIIQNGKMPEDIRNKIFSSDASSEPCIYRKLASTR